MAINCPTFSVDRKKQPFDKHERADITRRIELQRRIMEAARQTPRAARRLAGFNSLRAQAVHEWTRYLSDLAVLTPQNTPRMLDKLVSDFGIHNRKLGLDPSTGYSVAGEVREGLLDAKRTIEGLISTAGRISVLEKVQPLSDSFRRRTSELGMSPTETAALFDDLVTVGQIPNTESNTVFYRKNTLGHRTLTDVVQRRRYSGFLQRMSDAGFSTDETKQFIEQAIDVGNAFDQVAAYAHSVGVEIERLDNIGFFSRQVTQRFQNRLRDLNQPSLLETAQLSNIALSSRHAKSRSTFHYIPEDLSFVSDILGRSPMEITMMLDDPLQWRQYLHQNVSAQQLDILADAGVLQKLPMSSREVYDYFTRQFNLPLQMDEMFVLDPVENIKNYTQSLQRATGNSALLQRIISGEAISKGWAITRRSWDEAGGLQGEFATFVPIGDGLDRLAEANNFATQELLEIALGLQPGELAKLSDMFVHPIVADQFASLMEISMSPSYLGQTGNILQLAARALSTVSNKLTKTVLATPQYVFRTVMQNTVAFHAGGGAFHQVPLALLDIQKLIGKGLGAFDNTTKRFVLDGKELTYRELLESFLVNRGHSVAPGTNLERLAIPTKFNPKNAFEAMMGTATSINRAAYELFNYTMAHGDPVLGRKIPVTERLGRLSKGVAQGLDRLLDKSYAPFAYTANFFDVMYKWALTLSTVERIGEPGQRVAQFLSSQQTRNFSTSKDLYRHIDEYFVDPYKVGSSVRFVNDYIQPFAVWAMSNPPMIFRHLMRNPHQFLNYHRLRSIINQPLEDDEEFNDNFVPTWQLEGSPLFATRDEQGRPVVILTDNYDPISDTLSYALGTGNTVRRMFGGDATFDEQERQDVAEGRGALVGEVLQDIVSSAHLPWRIIYEQITGTDAFTGREFTEDGTGIQPTFLGVRMAPRAIYMLNKIPALRTLDDVNPGDVFGTPSRRDVNDNLIDPGTLSIFGSERTSIRSKDYDVLGESFALKLFRAAGLQIRTIDYDREGQRTLSEISHTAREIERNINDSLATFQSSSTMSDSERERLMRYREEQIYYWFTLRYDHARVKAWAQENGVLPQQALRELDKLNRGVRDLPDPSQDLIDSLLQEAAQMHSVPRQVEP